MASKALDICTEGLYSSYAYGYPMESQQTLFRYSTDLDLASQKVAGIPLNQGANKCDKCDRIRIYARQLCRPCYMSWWKKTPKGILCEKRYTNSDTRKLANKRNNKNIIQTYGRSYFIEAIRKSRKKPEIILMEKKYKKIWKINNPEKVRLSESKRKELIRNLIHNYSIDEWEQKKRITNGFCPKCNNYVGVQKLTLDHITPLSKAPNEFIYTINEIQPLCRSCNTSKGNRYTKNFMVEAI